MPTPGCLFLRGKPVDKQLSLETFVDFVSTTLIPAIVDFVTETLPSSTPLVLRYESMIPGSAFPCILLVRLDDISSLHSDAWKDVVEMIESEVVRVDNDLIEIGASTEWRARIYELSQRFEGQTKKPGRGSYMVTAANEPAAGLDDEFDEWYRKQHLDMLSMVFGYRRSTRYKLVHPFPAKHESKPDLAQAFAAQDSSPIPASWQEDNLPRYLAIHEWDDRNVDKQHATMPAKSEWAKRIVGTYKKYQREDWNFAEAIGEDNGRL